jgi:hypothetical protein
MCVLQLAVFFNVSIYVMSDLLKGKMWEKPRHSGKEERHSGKEFASSQAAGLYLGRKT